MPQDRAPPESCHAVTAVGPALPILVLAAGAAQRLRSVQLGQWPHSTAITPQTCHCIQVSVYAACCEPVCVVARVAHLSSEEACICSKILARVSCVLSSSSLLPERGCWMAGARRLGFLAAAGCLGCAATAVWALRFLPVAALVRPAHACRVGHMRRKLVVHDLTSKLTGPGGWAGLSGSSGPMGCTAADAWALRFWPVAVLVRPAHACSGNSLDDASRTGS